MPFMWSAPNPPSSKYKLLGMTDSALASETPELEEQSQFPSKPTLSDANPAHPLRPSRNWFYILTVLNACFFLSSLVLSIQTIASKASLIRNEKNALLRVSDWYSPVHDLVDITIVHTKVNGTLLDTNKSIFRQPPSAEVDAAWNRIGSLMPHVINTEDVVRLGKDPSKAARFPESWGFGTEAYMAELDVLHTIHCLNAIRRDVHWKHYFSDRYPDGDFPPLHKVHTDHCFYIVLQDLMCHATADMITTPWVEGQLNPFPDFNINRKCRDFSALLEWHEATAVTDMEGWKSLRRPDDVVPYPMSEEFHRLFNTDEATFQPSHNHEGAFAEKCTLTPITMVK